MVYKLEDRLANSGPIRQLARTIIALYQRGSWELRHLKSFADKQKQLGQPPLAEAQEEFIKKYKQLENEIKKRMEGKM